MPEQKFLTDLKVAGTVDLNNLKINTAQGTDGQVLTSTGTGVGWEDSVGVSETAERIEVTVKNISGGSLSKGTVVHTSPSANPPNGNVIEVIAADYDNSTKMPAIGILNETIANEAEGSAVMMGALSGINTSSFSIGDELYVGNLGTLTNSKPTTAGQLIQKIAVVIKSHASNGLIKIFGAGRSNDVPLPLYIDNTNQRVGIGDPTPSYTLDVNGTIYGSGVRSGRYYGTSGTSSYLDLDSGAPYSLIASSEISVTDTITCNDLTATEPGGIAASNGAVYGLRFYGYGNTTYYVDPNDSTTSAILNGNVGIGTTSPDSKLEVNGDASIRSTNKLYFGQSTTSLGSWTTRMYANGSEHRFNAQDFVFSNEGYANPATEYLSITSASVDMNGYIYQVKEDYDIDASRANAIYQATRSTQTDRGTWPGTYYYGVNFGDRTKGIQLAAPYSSANNLYFRSGTDNSASENGANAWKNWRQLYHVDYHPEADKWTTARTITLAGDLSGSVSIDGSANVTLTAAVNDDSHDLTWANIDGETANSVNGWGGLRHQTNDGYIDFGPANTSHAHIYTDRPNFYFNKELLVNNQQVFHTGYHPNADTWTTARTITIGSTGKSVNGSGNVSWTLSEIGAAAAGDENIIDGATSIWNADGDGDVFTYNDSNPVHNGKTSGAVINIRADGAENSALVRAGVYTGDHISVSRGYYVGNQLNTTNSTTTQVINSSGYWSSYPVFPYDSFSKSNISTRTESGFYQDSSPSSGEGWPALGGNTSWAHLISCTHSNDSNYYSMQLSASFYNQNLYYRSTAGSGTTGWSKMWSDQNDGAGSGLDADKLDNLQGSYYDHRGYTIDNNYLGGYYVSGGTEKPNDNIFGAGKFKVAMLRGGSNNLGFGSVWNDVFWLSTYNGGDVKKSVALVSSKSDNTSLWIAKQDYDSSSWGTGYLFWNSGNDGSGSGLDADLLDGAQGGSYLRSDTSDTFNAGNSGSFEVQGIFKVSNPAQTSQTLNISNASTGNQTYIQNGSGGTILFGAPAFNTTNIDVQGTAKAEVFTGRFNSNYYTDHADTGDSIRVAGDVVAYYSSDKRYKENIKPIESPIEKVKSIRGVTFQWNEKSHKETGKKDVGVIAQEVEEVLPEIVQTRDNGYKAVDYQKLTAVLIEAVKEQQKQIDELKSIINGST